MKKILLIVVAMLFITVGAFAIEPDFTGDFTFELRANPQDPGFDHTAPVDFVAISADIDGIVDDNNMIHTSISGTSGGPVEVGDAYLETAWGFMTTKLGNAAYDSQDYGVSSKAYETKARGIAGGGVFAEVPLRDFTVSGAKTFGAPDCAGAVGVAYSSGIIDSIGISYFPDVKADRQLYHAFTISGKVIIDDLSAGAGFRYDNEAVAYGGGVRYDLSPTWIAAGVGVEEDIISIGADTGLDFETWGGSVAIGYIEKVDCVNFEAWYKIGEVTLTGGYDYNESANDEVFAKVTASF